MLIRHVTIVLVLAFLSENVPAADGQENDQKTVLAADPFQSESGIHPPAQPHHLVFQERSGRNRRFLDFLFGRRRRTEATSTESEPCTQNGVDGCSVPLVIPAFFRGRFTPACNRHDVCYGCGAMYSQTRHHCDVGFLNDMKAQCRQHYLLPQDSGSTRTHKTLVLRILNQYYPQFQEIYGRDTSYVLRRIPFLSRSRCLRTVGRVIVLKHWIIKLNELLRRESEGLPAAAADDADEDGSAENYDRISLLSLARAALSAFRQVTSGVTDVGVNACNAFFGTLGIPVLKRVFIQCDDVQLLTCHFFAFSYYSAVSVFGESRYSDRSHDHCSEAYVQDCLPEVDV
ncbi:uncharacterized protein LOC101858258 [Aplysia californica]|uniref:Uncharacterized protein LOC101858258 n=1 Tax=Aplysia californica TaxID=6500 RepID=A0ABM0JK11_APLCA|nr:uncharacterized protein LOC101858258 [Aplysia californica]